MKNHFPADYFSAICLPGRMFHKRSAFGWLKITVMFIFINACLMVPVTLSLSSINQFDLGLIAPKLTQEISDSFADRLHDYQLKNGELQGHGSFSIDDAGTLLAVDLDNKWQTSGNSYHKTVNGYENALILQRNRLIIADDSGYGFEVAYPVKQMGWESGGAQELSETVGQLWLQQYKPLLMAVLSPMIFAGLLMTNALLMIIFSIFLWLTGRSNFSAIQSFKEAAVLILMAAGLPSMAAMIAGIAGLDIATTLLVQPIGTVLMVSLIFWRTHFQDGSELRSRHPQASGGEP